MGGASLSFGYSTSNDVTTVQGTVQNGSNLDALGDIAIVSGDTITVEASDIYGDGAVSLDAQNNINIIAATQTNQQDELHESSFIGLQASISNNVYNAYNDLSTLYNQGSSIGNGYDAANAGFSGLRAYDSVMGAMASPVSGSIESRR